MRSNEQFLQSALESFDGKSVEALAVLFKRMKFEAPVVHQLLDVIEHSVGHQPSGASWLLKQASDEKHPYEPKDISRMICLLTCNLDFGTTLHLLQIVGNAQIPKSDCKKAFSEFGRLSNSGKTLFRAWSLNALHTLAEQHPNYRTKVSRLLIHALETDAPSVKARLRLASGKSSYFRLPAK